MICQTIYLALAYIKTYKLFANKQFFVAAFLFSQIVSGQIASAKLGNSIDTFTQKMAVNFKLVSQEKKEQKTYFHFSVITDSKIQEATPGFGGGLTITTESGKISGESLLVSLGSDDDIGIKLAAVLCLNLAYEALGKAIPHSAQDQDAELKSYMKAVKDAMARRPGHINYSAYTGQLLFSQTNNGNLLFVINGNVPVKH